MPAGCLTGAVCGWLTAPLDVIKTRLMVLEGAAGDAPTGVLSVCRQIVRTGGIGALFQGAGARSLWLMLFTMGPLAPPAPAGLPCGFSVAAALVVCGTLPRL